MRIGIDVSQTGRDKAGCGYLADSTTRQLIADYPADEWLLYPHFGEHVWDADWATSTVFFDRPNVSRGPTFPDHGAAQYFWANPPLDLDAALGDPDLVHAHNFFCPTTLRRARLVYTLYDLAFLENPEWTTEANRLYCFEGCFQASLHADLIVSISDFSRDHFLRTFPHYPADRVKTVHLASRFDAGSVVERPQRLSTLTPDGFWLAVGTIEPRKNYIGLVKAYAEACRRNPAMPPLVLVGKEGWLMEKFPTLLSGLGIADRIHFAGYVSDAELCWLYRYCRAFLYPSFWEGFGLPVLEALSQGAAVVTSTSSSIPEVVGEAGIMVEPTDIDGLAAAILAVETEDARRAALKALAPAQVAKFSWALSARRLRALYDTVMALPRYRPQPADRAA